MSNPPSGKRRSRGSNDTEPKSVKPEHRVREYPKEPFVVSNSAQFCRGCSASYFVVCLCERNFVIEHIYEHNGQIYEHNRQI